MTLHWGKVQNYLGMKLDYNDVRTIKVSMIDYIDKIIAVFDKLDPKRYGINTSTAPDDLYKIDVEWKNLSP